MSQFTTLSVLFVIRLAYLAEICSADGCPGGLSEGQEIVDSTYFRYRCVNGERQPQGCVSEKGDQVPIGGSFVHMDSQVVCQQSGGSLTLSYSGCAQGGVAKAVGEKWTEGNSVLSCVQDGNTARIVTVGCVDDGSNSNLDETKAKGDSLYKCKKNTGGAAMDKVGCVFQGKDYTIGQTYSGSKEWYTCTNKGSEPSGCVHNNQQLRGGDHINEGDAAYACKVTSSGAYMEPFACLGADGVASVDRRVGCFWNEGGAEYTCKDVGGGKLAKVKLN